MPMMSRGVKSAIAQTFSLVRLALVICPGSATLLSVAHADDRWDQVWNPRTDIRVEASAGHLPIYQDPQFPSHFLVFDSHYCWIIRMDMKSLVSAGCGMFQKTGDQVHLTRLTEEQRMSWSQLTPDGYVNGVSWSDAVYSCLGTWALPIAYNRITKGPEFYDRQVVFHTCNFQKEFQRITLVFP